MHELITFLEVLNLNYMCIFSDAYSINYEFILQIVFEFTNYFGKK